MPPNLLSILQRSRQRHRRSVPGHRLIRQTLHLQRQLSETIISVSHQIRDTITETIYRPIDRQEMPVMVLEPLQDFPGSHTIVIVTRHDSSPWSSDP
jgi:hypothetical protein